MYFIKTALLQDSCLPQEVEPVLHDSSCSRPCRSSSSMAPRSFYELRWSCSQLKSIILKREIGVSLSLAIYLSDKFFVHFPFILNAASSVHPAMNW